MCRWNCRYSLLCWPLVLWIAFAVCSEALGLPITHQLVVNPIQVCNDAGTTCANPDRELFLAETDKIWSQAGIDVKFLDWRVMNDSDALSIDPLSDLTSAPNNQSMGGDIINMWFVQSISGAFGKASINGRTAAISDGIFSYSGGAGRRDTIAHELGHTLDLPHIAGDFPLNLMEEGGPRTPATNIDQIYPDGDQRDQLFADQIDTALDSQFLELLDFSIPGDANIDGVVDELDVADFIDGWLNEEPDPGEISWRKGDFDLDAKTTLADAFILHKALIDAGMSGLNFSQLGAVPEPATLVLAAFALIGLAGCGRSCRQTTLSRERS